MQYGVPLDLDLNDLDEINHAWEIVMGIVEWWPVEHDEEHTTPDGESHTHNMQMWFPAVLSAAPHGAGAMPVYTYYGPMAVFETRKDATKFAKYALRQLQLQRKNLETELTELTAKAAEVEVPE
jgi:hypothetical protein